MIIYQSVNRYFFVIENCSVRFRKLEKSSLKMIYANFLPFVYN